MGIDEGHHHSNQGGNLRVVGLNATTGDQVWEHKVDLPVWNFHPVFASDDTFLFMDFTGEPYRLSLSNGTRIWKTSLPFDVFSFSDGGLMLGPNGVAYTCSNPGVSHGVEGQQGVVRAFRFSDGQMLWQRLLPEPCNSWPAIGRLGGADDELSVVATIGSFPGLPGMPPIPQHAGVVALDAATGNVKWQYQAPIF